MLLLAPEVNKMQNYGTAMDFFRSLRHPSYCPEANEINEADQIDQVDEINQNEEAK